MTNNTQTNTNDPSPTQADMENTLTTALARITKRIDLTQDEMQAVMTLIMQGKCPDATLGALLMGLHMKGESIDEITASAQVMRQFAKTIEPQGCDYLLDIVGTGGDDANLFNVSTASAFVASSVGAQVAKHGNRGVSSSSGSSDVLTQLGVNLDISLDATCQGIEQHGIGFLFAPNHHTAMKHAIGVRRALKIRTIFNILGPLTNPAGVQNLVIGVFTHELCEPIAHVMKNLGARHVMVVSSKDGLDEISLATRTKVAELKDGDVRSYEILPEDVGIDSQTLVGLNVESAEQSLDLITNALSGEDFGNGALGIRVQKARDMIALNAGAGIYVAGLASNLANGVNRAQAVIQNGQALDKLKTFAEYTQSV